MTENNDSTNSENEKRFTLAYEKGNWWAVRDYDITLWKEEVISLLNELHEENSLLKDIITDIVVQLDANHTSNTYQMIIPINRVIFNELNRRLTETSFNEELRRVLDD